MDDRRLADAPPPGTIVKQELERRGWSQVELAEIMGRSALDVSNIVIGRRAISPQIAKELAAAFGTEAEYWTGLETAYQLQRTADVPDAVVRRARLYQFAPIKEMMKRQWLEPSDDIDVLEEQVKRFYGVSDLDAPLELPHAARRNKHLLPAQWAWLFRARHLAQAVQAAPFSGQSLKRGLEELRLSLMSGQEARRASTVLAKAGVRLLIIEPIQKAGIDGATFWLDQKSPVIALSLRYDRVDCFWFTLAHELGHIARRDSLSFDSDLIGDGAEAAEDEAEVAANGFATDYLIPRAELDDFIVRTTPLYAKQRVLGFAARIGVHPAIVVGQLQFRKEIEWSSFRGLLEKVRDTVTQSTLTDGWGHLPPALA